MTAIAVEFSVVVNSAHDDEYADLNRRATQAKQAGDLLQAVALLRQATEAAGPLYRDTRLAKLLEQAGQPLEALAEINWLIERSQLVASTERANQPASVVQHYRVVWLLGIHREAILICKRAKLPEHRLAYEQRHDVYLALQEKLEPLAEADTAKIDTQKALERQSRRALWKK